MAAELATTLLQFQASALALEPRGVYDDAARNFVQLLASIPASGWPKDAETEEQVFAVSYLCVHVWECG